MHARGLRHHLQRLGVASAGALALGPFLLAAPAMAATGSIDHVEGDEDALQVVMSLADLPEGVSPDLETVTVTFDDEPVPATAESLAEGGEQIRRTAIIAMDVSNSMQGPKFEEAKLAANAFLDNVPEDVHVGLVTFADDVTVAQEPTQDTESVRAVLETLELSRETKLYDGVLEAVQTSGAEGARSILVLSDGRDTSTTSIDSVTAAVEKAELKLDVVALAQSPAGEAPLQQLAASGDGQLLSADDPAALSTLFAGEAAALAQQVLVTVKPPADIAGKEGTLSVTLQVDGEPTTDAAFVALPSGGSSAETDEAVAAPRPVESGMAIPREWMYGGLAATVISVVFILFLAFGGQSTSRQDAVDRSIEAYTRKGAKKLAEANKAQQQSSSVTQQAVAVAANVLEGQKGLEAALGSRLEAAGMALKPAEWLLAHFGVAIGLGFGGLLFGGGSILYMFLGLVVGIVLPWLFLALKKKRRLAAFKEQMADTLQLMSGALSAGLSLAQSVDTVVREGSDPMAAEFRRALVETRLGVEIEDAMAGIAERMGSVDFEWVVMAIRIQRDVGGNLSELLNTVADTIREREYLERQVLSLSAEGRLSVWILGGLPPGFMAYLMMANGSYVQPMFTNPMGWVMLTLMGVLLTGGIFWMKKLVKVEV